MSLTSRFRFFASCGLVPSPYPGDPAVFVVAGGQQDIGYDALASTEYFDVSERRWRSWHDLPLGVTDAAGLQYKDTLLLVGGDARDTILEFNPDLERWDVKPEHLDYPVGASRAGMAQMVNEDYLVCHN